MGNRNQDLDETTRQIAERMLNTPPKPHKEMKLAKRSALPTPKESKTRPASKGRVHKGKTRV